MKNQILEMVENTGDTMSALGFFPGVLAARWTEIAIEQAQDNQAFKIYWMMRQNLLGMEKINEN